ncbi:DUF72 domain-containing protein [Candidatus Aerophobetes bacterium]|uniref:DUF72 domain-containing protein n=1 Tax=Aerophobetes bacterium TaxID=2030807 RepID=A0A7V5HZ83_UNCAE|nr:DUF72 domain-containing protein [Candidatus Aerophobetes bacterium]HHF98648.1 DUF72 domain-containing protein [Candidatus Aerophobetes bacterium]
MEIIIGTSGWWYEHWRGRFYPESLDKSRWFNYYAKFFNSVEINSSFYRLPFPNMVKGWAKKAPPTFKFTLKMWRRITHLKKLKDVKQDIETFFTRISPLEKNLGAILYQFPPSLKCNLNLLEDFLGKLPSNLDQAVEFRNESWFTSDAFSILKKYRMAYCIVSMPNLPEIIEITSDIAYIRFHGKEILYGSCYSEEEILKWAEKIKNFSTQGVKKVYIYFNNDYNAYAVANALQLKETLENLLC